MKDADKIYKTGIKLTKLETAEVEKKLFDLMVWKIGRLKYIV